MTWCKRPFCRWSVGRQVAKFLARHKVPAVLIDTNAREILLAKRAGLESIAEDAMQINPDDHEEFYDCGNLLAFTSNSELNELLCRRWGELLDGSAYRWEDSSFASEPHEHLLAGKRVWQSLPLSRWMQPNEDLLDLRILNAAKHPPPRAEDVLLTWDGNSVLIGPPQEIKSDDQEWLAYAAGQSVQINTLPLLRQNVIFTDQKSLYDLYRQLLEIFHQQNEEIEIEPLLNEMWRHEEEFTSLVGHGIAIPHARTTKINKPSLIVARPRTSVTCPLTGHSVDLVFMLISPDESPDDHLQRLARIARLVGTRKQRDAMLQAESEAILHDEIMNYSK